MPFTEDDFEKYCAVIGNGYSMPEFSEESADEMVEFIDKVGNVKSEILEMQEQLERVYNVLEEMESDFPQSAWDGAEDDSTDEDW